MNKLKVATLIILMTHFTGCSTFQSANSSPSTVPTATEMPNASVASEPGASPSATLETGEKVLKPIDVSNVNTNDPLIGGSTEKSMDANDKIKMSKALDKAPGKPTEWTNERTGITYTVTPIKKIVINNNPFCREYETVIAHRSNSNSVKGTACIGDDGNWHSL
jgi:surface antigen